MSSLNVGRIAPLPSWQKVTIGETFIPASAPPLMPHRHRFAQLHLVLEGSYEESSRGRDFVLGPGSGLFRPAEELHANRFGTTAVRGLLLDIAPCMVTRLLPAVDLSRPLYFAAHTFDDLCHTVHWEAGQDAAERDTMLHALALMFSARVSRHVRNRPGAMPSWVAETLNIINERYSENIGLYSLSLEVGVPPTRLGADFRRCFHQSVGRFLRQVRLQRAWAAIVDADIPLSEVALLCGFYDQPHLTRAFHRQFGVTPGELRRRSNLNRTKVLRTYKTGAPNL